MQRELDLRVRSKDGTYRSGTIGNQGGRPRLKGRAAHTPHASRPRITRHKPVHVTMRIAPDMRTLRGTATFKAIRRATFVAARILDARIIHLSIQRNHLHLLVEANTALELGEGMRRFAISAARQLNRVNRRKGRVFADRYHAEVIDSPRQARHALAYVLNNWRRHRVDDDPATWHWHLDRYSSAIAFDGWRDLPRGHIWPLPRDYEPLIVQSPHSWLLAEGWRAHGEIAMDQRPGQEPLGSR